MTDEKAKAFREGVVEGIRLYHEALHRPGSRAGVHAPQAPVVSEPPGRVPPGMPPEPADEVRDE